MNSDARALDKVEGLRLPFSHWSICVLMAIALAMSPRTVSAQCDLVDPGNGNTCMNDITSCNLLNGCTANDVFLAIYNVVGTCNSGLEHGLPCVVGALSSSCVSGGGTCVSNLIQCTIGEMITVSLQAEMVAQAAERWDIGLYVALDGGDALSGICLQQFLNDLPLEPGSTGSCTPVCSSSGGGCLKDNDCPLGETCDFGYEPNGGDGPFYDGECTEDPDDLCGDLEQGVPTFLNLPPITIMCADEDGNGFLDLGTCTSWDNNRSAGTVQKPSCMNQFDTLPNTSSKCKCEAVQVGTILVCDDAFCPPCEACGPSGFCEPITCDPADACNTAACDPATNLCVQTPIACDPIDACNTAACDPVFGCEQTPIACDPIDVCHTASCFPLDGCGQTTIDCDPIDACHTALCDPVFGCEQTPIACDPIDACHTASCFPLDGCGQTTIACDPINACHTALCDPVTGSCDQTEIPCDPIDACHTASCDPLTGACVQTPLACDPCTTCDLTSGTCIPDCGNGVCQSECGENCSTCLGDCPLTCDDGIACTNPTCNPADIDADANGCVSVANDNKCGDGIACTVDACDPNNLDADLDGCVYTCPVLTIDCPIDLVFECTESGDFGTPTTGGGCGTVTIQDPVVSEVAGCGNTKTILRGFSATDECGSEASCVQTIEFVDTTPPTCPGNLVIECDESVPPPTSTDDCGTVIITNIMESSVPGECPNEEQITRTFDATDDCGVSVQCVQIIDVVDTIPPVVICPADFTVECNEVGDFGEPIVSDNCESDPIVTVIVTEIPEDCLADQPVQAVAGISPPPKLKLQRDYTISDGAVLQGAVAGGDPLACGNEATCTQIVTIIDTIPPVVLACPGNTDIACGGSFEFTIPTSDGVCAGDLAINCTFSASNPNAFTVTELPGGGFRVTTNDTTSVSVTCTSTDECANESVACQFQINSTCPRCGDGIVNQPSEQCDSGGIASPSCDPNCTRPVCGDNFVNRSAGEECDPPSNVCSEDCQTIEVPAVSTWGMVVLVLLMLIAINLQFRHLMLFRR